MSHQRSIPLGIWLTPNTLLYRGEYSFVVVSLRKLADTFDKSEVTVVKVSSQFIQQVTLRLIRRV